jgi:hypothetical protein
MEYPLIFTKMQFIEDFNKNDASCLSCDAKKCVTLVPVLRRSLLPPFHCSHSFSHPQNESTKSNQSICTCITLRTQSYSESFESSLLTF